MRALILVLALIIPSTSHSGLNIEWDHYAWIPIASKHTATEDEFEEFNPGIGIQSFVNESPVFLAAGVFDNSFDSRHSKDEFGEHHDISYFVGIGLEYPGKYVGIGGMGGLNLGYSFPAFFAPYLRLGSRDWLIQSQLMILPLNLVDESSPNVFGLSFTVNLGKIFDVK